MFSYSYKNSNKQYLRKNSLGSVLVELTVVLPVILFIGILGIEFANILRLNEMMSTLSREGARQAYRTCRDDPAIADACLQGAVAPELVQYLRARLPECTAIITFLNRPDPTTDNLDLTGYIEIDSAGARGNSTGIPIPTPQGGRYYSKILVEELEEMLLDGLTAEPLYRDKGSVAICETFCTSRILSPLAVLTGMSRVELYETTMF